MLHNKGGIRMHPAKWRETIDPFELEYHHFRLTEILGYPHAGNDVFHAKGIYQQQETEGYIKVAGNRVRISEEKLTPF